MEGASRRTLRQLIAVKIVQAIGGSLEFYSLVYWSFEVRPDGVNDARALRAAASAGAGTRRSSRMFGNSAWL
ncbi:MAG: hypothetical protein ACI87W_002060 [Halieaceae bacterium]|jgi:hypothetical protein